MFTIKKSRKIQVLYYQDKLGSGQVLTDFLTPDSTIPNGGVDLAVKQIQGKLRWTLHDIYSIPTFTDISDIYLFFNQLEPNSGESNEEYKKWIVRDLCLAWRLSTEYLVSEGYYVPSLGRNPTCWKDLVNLSKKWNSLNKPTDKIWYCTILKEVLWFFRIIRNSQFHVDYATWKVDFRDKDFIKKIIAVFWEAPFSYDEENSIRFSETSREMQWSGFIDGRKMSIYAGFDVKSISAVVEKMDGQEKYNLPDAIKDIHRMRIEVKEPSDAIRIGKVLFQKLWWSFELENSGTFLTQELIEEYTNSYLVNKADIEYKEALQKARKTQKKSYSAERQELKLTRAQKNGLTAMEIQIVLVDNQNETGYAHHDIYRMRRKITAKIRRHGWIWTSGIWSIIRRVISENRVKNGWSSSIQFSEEQIYNHILSLPNFLLPIRWKSEWNISRKSRIKINHYTTREVLEKYQANYPEATSKDTISMRWIDTSTWVEYLIPLSRLSFPSTPPSSSQTPSQDRSW